MSEDIEKIAPEDLAYLQSTSQDVQTAQKQLLMIQGAQIGFANFIKSKYHIEQGDIFDNNTGVITRGPELGPEKKLVNAKSSS